MSLPADTQAKKRKKSLAAGLDAEEPRAKKSRKEGKDKKQKKNDKGKTRDSDGQFRVVRASMVVSIPPVFASDPRAGVEEMLDSMVMRYVPALQGVVLVHSNLQFLDRKASIKADCPYAVCPIDFDATVWSPSVGMKLLGRVNLCSPDHVSLLVHRTFNVSIPRHHIPTDHWEFEYGPAENDPEFGPHAVPEDGDDAMNEGDNAKGEDTHEIEGGGRWVHKVTGDRLGGPDRQLEFTVIGLTVANNMLSLIGSIQPDPFSPEHIPANASSAQEATEDADVAAEDVDLEDEAGTDDGEDSDEDDDPFAKLGKMGDAAAQRQAEEAQASKMEKENERTEKRKRKEENAGTSESKHAKKKKKA